MTSPRRTKRYSEVTGGVGPFFDFRTERYLVRVFLANQDVMLVVGGHEFPVYDMSMNGLSFNVPAVSGVDWATDQVHDIKVVIRDSHKLGGPQDKLRSQDELRPEEIYDGAATVARIDVKGRKLHVGLRLVDGFLDLPLIRDNYEERLLAASLRTDPQMMRQQIPQDYREVVERAVHFLCFFKQSLERHERRYKETGDEGRELIHDLEQRALEHLRGPWNEIRELAVRAAMPFVNDLRTIKKTKEYTETLITPLLLQSPVIHRSYTKPLGYAGDYNTMRLIYHNALEGPTVFSRVFHKLACEEPLARGVRIRKELVKELQGKEYDRLIAEGSPDEVFRATSVGCGPAQELAEFMAGREGWQRRAVWTLIDPEEQALSHAYRKVYPFISKNNDKLALRCKCMAFSRFLRDPEAVLARELQHFIYAAGLFDYLPRHLATELISVLYSRLTPGGLLAVGNAKTPNRHFWFGEFVLDWTLLYRTEAEMIELTAELEGAEVQVTTDDSGAYHFVLIRKR